MENKISEYLEKLERETESLRNYVNSPKILEIRSSLVKGINIGRSQAYEKVIEDLRELENV